MTVNSFISLKKATRMLLNIHTFYHSVFCFLDCLTIFLEIPVKVEPKSNKRKLGNLIIIKIIFSIDMIPMKPYSKVSIIANINLICLEQKKKPSFE